MTEGEPRGGLLKERTSQMGSNRRSNVERSQKEGGVWELYPSLVSCLRVKMRRESEERRWGAKKTRMITP